MADAGGPVDLVLEGGGVKGIALTGALKALQDGGWKPACVAGTSAGAIVASLLAAGYDADEMHALLDATDFHQFEDKGWEDRLPGGELLSIVRDRGIYEGDAFRDWIADLLAKKDVKTFADLRNPDAADDEQRRYRLRVIASDVSGRSLLALPQDAKPHLGIEPDDLSVALAVRMSMSIPLYFEPVVVKNPATGDEHVIVDGGLLSNFPVWLFDAHGREPRWPTFGLMLVEEDPHVALAERIGPGGDKGTIGFLKALVQTALEGRDRQYLEQATFARTIPIPTLGVRTTEFDISPDRKQALYRSGEDAARAFLDDWSHERYKATYRSGPPPTRRETTKQSVRSGTDERP